MDRFDAVYQNSLKSDVKLINTVIGYISKKKGKQLRPQLCLLSARLCGEPTENTFKAAALIEIIHVATLIHDDVVDDDDKEDKGEGELEIEGDVGKVGMVGIMLLLLLLSLTISPRFIPY